MCDLLKPEPTKPAHPPIRCFEIRFSKSPLLIPPQSRLQNKPPDGQSSSCVCPPIACTQRTKYMFMRVCVKLCSSSAKLILTFVPPPPPSSFVVLLSHSHIHIIMSGLFFSMQKRNTKYTQNHPAALGGLNKYLCVGGYEPLGVFPPSLITQPEGE